MMNFIPILPLNVVVYPGETLNMQVVGPQNVQLVTTCFEEKQNFGIPVRRDDMPLEYGTLMEVNELGKAFKNGRLNVRAKGLRVFRILEPVSDVPEKLYKGAIVEYPENNYVNVRPDLEALIVSEVKRLYRLMHLERKFPEDKTHWTAYDLAHKVGLSLEEEYELLTILNEIQRMEYLRRHLNAMLPIVKELEVMKAKIQMNGHFRKFS